MGKTIKAALAVPPVRDFYLTPHRHSALGLRIVERILIEGGIQTAFFNFPLQGKKPRALPLPEWLGHLKPYIIPGETGPFSFFSHRKHFGPSFEASAEKILASRPDMVFISSFAWAYAEETIRLAKALREKAGKPLKIYAGGPGITVLPEFFYSSGLFDGLLLGEAEKSLPPLLDSLGLEGPAVPPLFPMFSPALQTRRGLYTALSFARGCPFSCAFCANRLTLGSRYRRCSANRVMEEFRKLPDSGPLIINFEDDNLFYKREETLALLKEMKKLRPDTLFTADNGLDYRLMGPEDVRALADLGFFRFNISLGTLSADLANKEKRLVDLERHKAFCREAMAEGIPLITYFIAGLEGDSLEGLEKTFLYLWEEPGDLGVSLFYPVPGLKGFTEKSLFLEKPPGLAASSSAWPWTGSLTTGEMVALFRLSRALNYLKKAPKNDPMTMKIREKRRLPVLLKKGNYPETEILDMAGKTLVSHVLSQIFP